MLRDRKEGSWISMNLKALYKNKNKNQGEFINILIDVLKFYSITLFLEQWLQHCCFNSGLFLNHMFVV